MNLEQILGYDPDPEIEEPVEEYDTDFDFVELCLLNHIRKMEPKP